MKFVFLIFLCCVFSLQALKLDNSKNKLFPSKENCGRQQIGSSLTNGRGARVGEFPWVVYVPLDHRRPDPSPHPRCTGALINDRYFIMIQYCLQYYLSKVHLGQFDNTQNVTCEGSNCVPVEVVDVERWSVHEPSNIALVRLAKNVEYTDNIQPICLPFEGFERAEIGATVYTSGWGLTSPTGGYTNFKKKVNQTIISDVDCQNAGCLMVQDYTSGIPCLGDEGGPVMHFTKGQWVLEAILTTFYYNICAIETPALISPITEDFLEWLVKNVHA